MQSTNRLFVRSFALILSLSFPLVARADLESDLKEPMRLMDAKQFVKASTALDKIAPRYQNQALFHYIRGINKLACIGEKTPRNQTTALLKNARASFRKALAVAPDTYQKDKAQQMLTAVDDICRQLNISLDTAPTSKPKTAPAPAKDKDAEIAELKQRLAQLEGTINTAKAAPANQLVVGPPDIPGTLPKLAPLKPTPKTARGRVVNRSGKPVAGVEIRVIGTTLAGQHAAFFPKTNAQGIFSTPLPDGIYSTRAEFKTNYNGQTFTFGLHPLDGDDDLPQDSRKGVVENYVWRLSGLRPEESEAQDKPWNYYGGGVQVDFNDLGKYGVINDKQGPRELAEFPDGFRIDLTFTPQGNLPDGLPGRAFSFSKSYKPSNSGLGPYLFPDFRFSDVPVGRYQVTAKIVKPDGTSRDLQLTTRIYAPLQTPALSQIMDFEPDASSVRPVNIRLYVFPES